MWKVSPAIVQEMWAKDGTEPSHSDGDSQSQFHWLLYGNHCQVQGSVDRGRNCLPRLDDNDMLLFGGRQGPSHGRGASPPVQIVRGLCKVCYIYNVAGLSL